MSKLEEAISKRTLSQELVKCANSLKENKDQLERCEKAMELAEATGFNQSCEVFWSDRIEKAQEQVLYWEKKVKELTKKMDKHVN